MVNRNITTSFSLQIVPSVEGVYFKDLKQTLKKEQCDVSSVFLTLSQTSPGLSSVLLTPSQTSPCLSSVFLTLSQTSPGLYVSAVQVF